MRPFTIVAILLLLTAGLGAIFLLGGEEETGLSRGGESGPLSPSQQAEELTRLRKARDAHRRNGSSVPGPSASGEDGALVGQPEAPPKVLLLSGTVRARKAPPPEHAQVMVTSSSGRTVGAVAEEGGEYRVEGPAGKIPRAVFSAEGFAARQFQEIPEGTRLNVVLERGVVFQGRLLDDAGKAAAGARIHLFPKGRRDLADVAGNSDSKGLFRLDAVAPGRYDLSIQKDDLAPLNENDVIIPPEGLQKDYYLFSGMTLTGQVLTKNGEQSIQGAQVQVIDRIIKGRSSPHQSQKRGPFITNADGQFSIPSLAPGEIRLMVKAQGFGTSLRSFTVKQASDTKNEVTIRLQEGSSIRGQVLDPEGQPVGWARITVEPKQGIKHNRDFQQVVGFLFGAVEHHDQVGALPPAIAADGQGRFVIDNAPGGQGYLQAFDPKGRFAPSLRTLVTLERGGGSGLAIELRLRESRTVTGVVQDTGGSPVSEARVWIGRIRTETAEDGAFVLKGVPEGDWTLGVAHPHFDRYRESVSVGPKGAGPLTIQLDPGNILQGIVRDRHHRPIIGARIAFWSKAGKKRKRRKKGAGFLGWALTDYAGNFYKGGLKVETLSFRVAAEGYFSELFQEVQTGPKPLDIVLAEKPWELSGSVVGSVLHASGSTPVYDFKIRGIPESHVQIFQGRFYIQNLQPGQRSFFVVAPGFQRQHITRVEIVPGKETDLPPVLLWKAVRLQLEVKDKRGRIIRSGKLHIGLRRLSQHRNPPFARRPVRPSGRKKTWVFSELRPGRYNLRLTYPGHRRFHRRFYLRRPRLLKIRLR